MTGTGTPAPRPRGPSAPAGAHHSRRRPRTNPSGTPPAALCQTPTARASAAPAWPSSERRLPGLLASTDAPLGGRCSRCRNPTPERIHQPKGSPLPRPWPLVARRRPGTHRAGPAPRTSADHSAWLARAEPLAGPPHASPKPVRGQHASSPGWARRASRVPDEGGPPRGRDARLLALQSKLRPQLPGQAGWGLCARTRPPQWALRACAVQLPTARTRPAQDPGLRASSTSGTLGGPCGRRGWAAGPLSRTESCSSCRPCRAGTEVLQGGGRTWFCQKVAAGRRRVGGVRVGRAGWTPVGRRPACAPPSPHPSAGPPRTLASFADVVTGPGGPPAAPGAGDGCLSRATEEEDTAEPTPAPGLLQVAERRQPLSSVSSLEVHFDLLDLAELADMSDQELAEVFADSDDEAGDPPAGLQPLSRAGCLRSPSWTRTRAEQNREKQPPGDPQRQPEVLDTFLTVERPKED
ncbi:Dysbindin domain-containing protein 1 [Galemys pyrenaicus]|uniref:Dysbindin domain-containing protein 1 n=1 Tax=Galemys pyrenaicus TaxID=202257 RepID=A0A8J6DG18_GALPY|nr:Dysbindin domain-containing protein 1 [Galemys pyrenaicus]